MIAGIHSSDDLATVPVTDMIRWSVLQAKDKHGTRTRHLVGRVHGHGRVSPPVVRMDIDTLCVVSNSGRGYRLAGPPIPDPDARYVFTSWVRVTGRTQEKDMTRSFMRLRAKQGFTRLNPW